MRFGLGAHARRVTKFGFGYDLPPEAASAKIVAKN
jgi:hypothetical protein